MGDWECSNCTYNNESGNFLCKTCKCARATSTRKIRPPAHFRGKFMDKRVSDLVQKATKRKPATSRSEQSNERVKRAIKKKAGVRELTASQKRRESLMEKQFKAKADQIAKLTIELELMKSVILENSTTGFIGGIEEQLKMIGELMVNSTAFARTPKQRKTRNISHVSDFDPNSPSGADARPRSKRKTAPTIDIYDTDDEEDDAILSEDDVEWEPADVEKIKIPKLTTKPERTARSSVTVTPSKRKGEFGCDQCDFRCFSAYFLKKHQLSHTDMNPFKCTHVECGFTASSKYFLLRHTSAEHGGQEGPKLFTCNKCTCSFSEKQSLVKHQKTHTKKRRGPKKSTARINIIDNSLEADELAKEVETIESFIEDSAEDEPEEDIDVEDRHDSDWVPEGGVLETADVDEEEVEEDEDIIKVDELTDELTDAPKKKPKHIKKTVSVKEKMPCPHDDCEYKSASSSHLARHRRTIHKDVIVKKKKIRKPRVKRPNDGTRPPPKKRIKEKKYTCEVCGVKATSMWYINRHMRSHTGEKPFVCEYEGCEYKAHRKHHLSRHIMNVHSTERPHKCDHCDFAGKTKDAIRQHWAVKHVTTKDHCCLYCDYACKLKDVLRAHTKKVHKYKCEPCVWEFHTEELRANHEARHKDEGILCQFCTHLAPDVQNLKEHSQEQHNVVLETRLPRKSRWLPVCEICGYQFPNASFLQNHKTYHTQHGILCHICENLFGDMELLKEHCLVVHGFGIDAQKKRERAVVPVISCTMCNFEFASEELLRNHSDRHRPDGSIVCEYCEFIAVKMGELMEHTKEVHQVDLEATPKKKKNFYCCSICKFLFPSQQKMEIHKLHHLSDGSVQCSLCPAIMGNMKSLKDHTMLMHSIKLDATYQRIRPYLFTCPVCNYMFENKFKLNQHRTRHLPDGSISCELCPYTTPDMEFLKIHMVQTHNLVMASEKKRFKRKKGDPPREKMPRRKVPKPNGPSRQQLSQLANHNITDILYGNHLNNDDPDYDPPIINRPYESEVSSYISPPSCAFDGSVNFDPRLQNPFTTLSSANFFTNLHNSINKESQPTSYQNNSNPRSLTITNSNTNNNFSFNQRTININNPVICTGNIAHSTPSTRHPPLSIDLSSLIPGGLPAANDNNPAMKRVKGQTKLGLKGFKGTPPVKPADPTPRLKAFPGLFM